MQPWRKRDLPYEVIPTNIPGAFASVGALEDFDLRMASTAALINQGLLWRRPGPGDDATLRAAWERTFSRVWCAQNRTIPYLEPQIGRTHNLRHAKRTTDNSFTSRNWAGASIKGSWTSVTGHWMIPTVSQPQEPQGPQGGWNSSSWVGIDGTYGSDDVLQAGVEQRVDASGNTSYVAWCEWFAPHYPNSPSYIFQTNISNFAVTPGDTIYCSVQYANPIVPSVTPSRHQLSFNKQQHANYLDTAGHIHELYHSDSTGRKENGLTAFFGRTGILRFVNATTGQHFSLTLEPPPGASFKGRSAEWIMEATAGDEPPSCLPKFTPVQFTSAICCGVNTIGDAVKGDTWNITRCGQMLTSVTLDAEVVTIEYIGRLDPCTSTILHSYSSPHCE
jgi:Peptidase A4 family